jgi:hypothetical protein
MAGSPYCVLEAHRHVEVPVGNLLRPSRRIGCVQGDLEAELLHLLLGVLTQAVPDRAVGNGQHADREITGLHARIGQHLLCERHVVLVGRNILVVVQRGRGDRAGGHLADIEEDVLHDEVAVHRMHDGLAHRLVVEGRLAQVHLQPHRGANISQPDLVATVSGSFSRRRTSKFSTSPPRSTSTVAALVGYGAGCRVGNDAQVDLVQVGQPGLK